MVRFGMRPTFFCSDKREVSVVEGSVHREQPPPSPPPPPFSPIYSIMLSIFPLVDRGVLTKKHKKITKFEP
jgi:hypothetical protein